MNHPFLSPRILLKICLHMALALGMASAKTVRTSQHASWQAAVNACRSGDVLIFDSSDPKGAVSDPPNDLQIVGGSATWNISKDVSDLVFFQHTPRIIQTGGIIKRTIATRLSRGTKFTGVDSSFFIMGNMNRGVTNYEVDGFLRATTFAFDGSFMGTSHTSLMNPQGGETFTKHASNFIINATDPVGDGSGTLICNIMSHGQVDWTPLHIINGRGITIAHINSEYTEWGDPFVKIENGVETVNIHHNLGGHMGEVDWNRFIALNDGTRGYPWVSARWGAFRIGGMNNSHIGGTNYTPFRSGVTGHALTGTIARDPYMTKWNANHGNGVNFAPGIRLQTLRSVHMSMSRAGEDVLAKVVSSAADCTTGFVDNSEKVFTDKLKNKPLRAGIRMHRPYAPFMPRIRLEADGPGEIMTGKSGKEIFDALKAGKSIYLGPGTYNLPGTLTNGQVWGSGMDQTILKFPTGIRCAEKGIQGLFNLTLEGGAYGYTQPKHYPFHHGFNGANVRFRGQSEAGINIGCTQNSSLWFLEFDNSNAGIVTCADGIPCGENGTGGGKLFDKFNVYASKFTNMKMGVNISGGTDGYLTFLGCRFENIAGTALIMQTQGNYVAGCDFINVEKGVTSRYLTTVHNCSFGGKGGVAITGGVREIISTTIKGYEPAIEISQNWALVSDVESDGSIKKQANTWIGLSEFSNVKARNGAFFGDVDLSQWVDASEVRIDQTPPSEPKGLSVQASGAHNRLTWSLSEDPESFVMQYIIERDGQEIGRTNFNYSANHHTIVPELWGAEGFPGPGVYKTPRPLYVDSNAAGKFTATSYKVVAVNFTQIRSDNKMAGLRMWPNGITPIRLNLDGKKSSDSIYVPLGSLGLSKANGEKAYTAVRYKALSQSGIGQGVTSVAMRRPTDRGPASSSLRDDSGDQPVGVYTLRGVRLGTAPAREARNPTRLREALRALGLTQGIFLVPAVGERVGLLESK